MIWVVAGAVVCGSISDTATAQVDSSAVPEPTVFEKIAKQRGTKVISSEEVGRIESTDARAVITAVIMENSHYRPSRVRGIRIDLRNEISSDHIYVEESELVYLKHELDSMDCSVADMRNESGAAHRIRGIARCRPSQSVPQAYCPGYYIGPESEGLLLSTFSGGNFRFPSERPSSLADAIGRAMSEFGLDDKIPTPELIALPSDDLDQIVASAVHHFPELASSPGIKAANYANRESMNSAWAIFWPYERVGDFARSLSVDCEVIGAGEERNWDCSRGRPRGYLTIPDQDREVVITGPAEREQVITLIRFAERHLQDEPNYADMDDWTVSSIHPLDPPHNTFWISWINGSNGKITFEIKESAQEAEERFEMVRRIGSGRPACGKNGA